MRKTIIILAALTLAGCGDKGKKSAEACQDWLDATTCGEFDFSSSVDCTIYEEYSCDISDYFTCLADNTTCDEATGIPDMTGWTDCYALASCD